MIHQFQKLLILIITVTFYSRLLDYSTTAQLALRLENLDFKKYVIENVDYVKLDNTICIVSYQDYSQYGQSFIIKDTVFDEENNQINFEDMFKLDCTHLLYLNKLRLRKDPRSLLEGQYGVSEMLLFASVEFGFLINIRRYRIQFSREILLNGIFKSTQDTATLLGNDILQFCGNSLAFGEKLELIYTKNEFVYSEATHSISNVKFLDVIEDDYGCWNTNNKIPSRLDESITLFEISHCDVENRDGVNDLPHNWEWEPRQEYIDKAKEELNRYISSIKNTEAPKNKGTGIVTLAYDQSFDLVYNNIQFLRNSSVTLLDKSITELPIQIFHNQELSEDKIIKLQNVRNVKVLSFKDIDKQIEVLEYDKGKNYHYKISALIATSFENVLFLDSDSIPMSDPVELFQTREYKETGLMLWPDMWRTDPFNPIYEVLDLKCINEQEIESGQFLINTKSHFQTILLAQNILRDKDTWYRLLFGDKDILKWAARYLRKPLFLEPEFPKSLGFEVQGFYCGQSIVHSFDGRNRFMHSNLLKHSEDIRRWNFNGYHYYLDGCKITPKFYMLNNWECVSFDNGFWSNNLVSMQPFLDAYLDFRNIKE
eukprot:NODE_32_length_37098_cov_1.132760.p7 type:complete len:597 gc:universal NODE_32_length_37098_cov_1.132760:15860-17650(+)